MSKTKSIQLCGAKARSNGGNPCRRPVLAYGRCRWHGGLSIIKLRHEIQTSSG